MEKHSRPPQGYYKSLETIAVACARMCDQKPYVLGVFEVERIVAKKICSGKPLFMLKWQGYRSSQNTWESEAHIPPELIEAFRSQEPDPVCIEEAQDRIGIVFERGMITDN